jgi:acid phosphatase class B
MVRLWEAFVLSAVACCITLQYITNRALSGSAMTLTVAERERRIELLRERMHQSDGVRGGGSKGMDDFAQVYGGAQEMGAAKEVIPERSELRRDQQKRATDDTASSFSSFSPWVQDYITFHKSALENGQLKEDAKYIIYTCKDGKIECGGIGDRVIGMIKMFYLAMMTRRVLVMDADFPVPLTLVLDPAHIQWNAKFPHTDANFPDLIWKADGENNLSLRSETRGYRIRQTGGVPRKLALDDLWSSELMANHLKMNQWAELASKMTLAEKAHEAMRAMFQISPTVVSRAEEFKASANITGPYIGMHMRKGDAAMGVEGPTASKRPMQIDRTTSNDMMMECWQEMKKDHPNVHIAYLASDDVKTKQNMSDADPFIHFAKDMKPFHVDLLARSNYASSLQVNTTDPLVAQGVIDVWAEMWVLAQSTCFILSKSMFSFGSLYLRDPKKCSVYLERCQMPAHRKGYYTLYGEAIYQRGFVVIENRTDAAAAEDDDEKYGQKGTEGAEDVHHKIESSVSKAYAAADEMASHDLVFSPWVQHYISFHQSSVADGKLNDGARYIIYECKDGSVRCGGAGDRLVGMIKMFYLALCTKRVLVIDSSFPIPLEQVLNPSHIEWNVSFPETHLYLPDMEHNDSAQLEMREDTIGYRIRQTNAWPRKKDLNDIWKSSLMMKHLEQHQWVDQANSFTLAAACKEAFRAMFKLDPIVIARAQEFKSSAGITGTYAGLHMRKGDSNMGVTGQGEAELKGLKARETDNSKTLSCYHEVKALHSNAFNVAYLASDDSDTKKAMAEADSSIHFATNMNPFHIDLLAREGITKSIDAVDPAVAQGVIDTWAEMSVLSESTCILLSQSMFSFGALYMRGARDCVIHLNSCHDASHREGHNSFYGEQILGRGWVVMMNVTTQILSYN